MLPYLKRETNSSLYKNYRTAILCYQHALESVRFTAPKSQAVNFALLFNSVNTSLRFLATNAAMLKKTAAFTWRYEFLPPASIVAAAPGAK